MTTRHFLIASALIATLAAPAAAHRQWLLPSQTVLSTTGQMVTVDAASSTNPFLADHNAMPADSIQVWAPDGSMGKVENAARGRYRSTFDVAIDKPGTWKIGSAASMMSGTFKLNGEDWAVGRRRGPPPAPGTAASAGSPPPMAPGAGAPGRPQVDPSRMVATVAEIPAGASDFDLTETVRSNQFFVTAGAPTDTVFQPTGKALEMVPVTHPSELVSDEPGKFRFLIDGKPAAGITVEVVPGGQRFRDAEHAQELTTDAEGVATVSWPIAGFYWLSAEAEDAKASDSRAAKRRMAYVATFEVLAP